MDPTSLSISYILSKLWLFVGGLFGSGAIGVFYQPAELKDHPKYLKGLIIGGIGGGTPVMIGGLVAIQLGLDPKTADVGMAIGFVVGISSFGVIGFIAKYFKNREGRDIVEVVQEARSLRTPVKRVAKKPARKQPTKANK